MRLIWLTICVVLLISGCANSARVAPFEFTHLSHSLAGDIYYPAGNGPYPGVLIVHGDGPIQRDAAGYYQPFVEILNRAGYAVASWDKPGVGDSTGNWLNQSMSQRSDELQQAIAHLRKMPDINDNQIGLLGFSQAGWVMPKALLADDRLSFMIAISPAINWQQQARYLTQSRMLSEGYSE